LEKINIRLQFISLKKRGEMCQHHACTVYVKKLSPHHINDFCFEMPLATGKLKIQCVTLTIQAGFNDVKEKGGVELEFHDDDMSTDELKQL
jgi:hypothetical protein